MLKPKDGSMNYKDINELSWNYMFIGACLTEEQEEQLKEEWNKQGGYKAIPWWQFVMENVKVELDIK